MTRRGEAGGVLTSSHTGSTGAGAPGRDRLVFVWDGGATSVALEPGRAIHVGRSRSATVQIEHASLSREHATFTFDGAQLFVVDRDSRNGTHVGGARIESRSAAPVEPGGQVLLGDVLVAYQAASGRPCPARAAWTDVERCLPLVARGTISILVLGETGVGKEVMATTIHRLSPRASGPFVGIHCAALPESLVEAELFGYERGAFTGAVTTKAGLLESAHGGTAFLDEITEVPLSTQAKLLRVVETKSVTRLGALRPREIDVRFVAAANKDIDALLAAGNFRDDLYYRLAGFTLHVPALRARVGEIGRLASEFACEASRSLGRAPPRITREALGCLERYPWPGNVRELKNAIECAVLLCPGESIGPEHLPARVMKRAQAAPTGTRAAGSLHEEVQELERARILEALERTGGNQSRAARELGISRRLLLERLDAYGAPRPRKGAAIGTKT